MYRREMHLTWDEFMEMPNAVYASDIDMLDMQYKAAAVIARRTGRS